MRIAAGILTIIGGFTVGFVATPILAELLGADSRLLFLPAFFSVMGGIYILRRRRYTWALTGAVCSLLFPVFGIPAIILLVKSKKDFLPEWYFHVRPR